MGKTKLSNMAKHPLPTYVRHWSFWVGVIGGGTLAAIIVEALTK